MILTVSGKQTDPVFVYLNVLYPLLTSFFINSFLFETRKVYSHKCYITGIILLLPDDTKCLFYYPTMKFYAQEVQNLRDELNSGESARELIKAESAIANVKLECVEEEMRYYVSNSPADKNKSLR